jgi:hypothetical protein
MSASSIRQLKDALKTYQSPASEEGAVISEREMAILVSLEDADGERDAREMNALAYGVSSAQLSDRARNLWQVENFMGPQQPISDDAWVERSDPRGTPDLPVLRAYSTTPATLSLSTPDLQAGEPAGVLKIEGQVDPSANESLLLVLNGASVSVSLTGAQTPADVATAILAALPAGYGGFVDAAGDGVAVTLYHQ